jgi:hypothetical protein
LNLYYTSRLGYDVQGKKMELPVIVEKMKLAQKMSGSWTSPSFIRSNDWGIDSASLSQNFARLLPASI